MRPGDTDWLHPALRPALPSPRPTNLQAHTRAPKADTSGPALPAVGNHPPSVHFHHWGLGVTVERFYAKNNKHLTQKADQDLQTGGCSQRPPQASPRTATAEEPPPSGSEKLTRAASRLRGKEGPAGPADSMAPRRPASPPRIGAEGCPLCTPSRAGTRDQTQDWPSGKAGGDSVRAEARAGWPWAGCGRVARTLGVANSAMAVLGRKPWCLRGKEDAWPA